MVDVDKAIIARIKKESLNFEILVDCNSAIAFRQGSLADIGDVLATRKIYSDAKKGLEASESAMKQIFGTDDPLEISKTIIKKGDIQLTAEYRQKLREDKKNSIINIIARNAVDPKTNLPIPLNRIINALDEAKVSVDEFQDSNKQVQDILKKLRPILPIAFVTKEIALKIPAEYAGKAYPTIRNFGELNKEEWQSDGSLIAVISIPGGLEAEMYDKLNSICHGNLESKVITTK